MLRLLGFLVAGCFHKWKIIGRGTLTDPADRPCGHYYHLQCERCGVVKRKDF